MKTLSLELGVPLATNDPIADRRSRAFHLSPGAAEAARDEWARAVSRGVASGDHAALDGLYRAWFDRSLALCRAWTRRDESFCLDVVQESMLRAVRAIRDLPSAAALDGWMTTLVRSASIDALRKEGRRLARERRRGHGEIAPRPVSPAELESVVAALRELSGEDSAILRARFLEGRSLRELADELGSTIGSVHGRVRRLLKRLRDRLREVDRD